MPVTELYVDELGTAPSHQRQCIGRRLADEMFQWGRERGCVESWLGTEPDIIVANALYDAISGKPEAIGVVRMHALALRSRAPRA